MIKNFFKYASLFLLAFLLLGCSGSSSSDDIVLAETSSIAQADKDTSGAAQADEDTSDAAQTDEDISGTDETDEDTSGTDETDEDTSGTDETDEDTSGAYDMSHNSPPSTTADNESETDDSTDESESDEVVFVPQNVSTASSGFAGLPTIAQSNIKKTGQADSYVDYDDGYYAERGLGLSRESYIEETATIVKDSVTNLYWNNTEKLGSAATAHNTCESLTDMNKGDWRVPTVLELATLLNYKDISPTIDDELLTVLFNDSTSANVWASEYSLASQEYAYFVNFKDGLIGNQVNNRYLSILCVSGNRYDSNINLKPFDGYAEETKSNLMWEDSSVIRTYLTWEAAIDRCEKLTLAGHDDWRMPNINEVLSIVDYSENLYQREEFVVASRAVWSSTAFPADAEEYVYTAIESPGKTSYTNKEKTRNVRCVRTMDN